MPDDAVNHRISRFDLASIDVEFAGDSARTGRVRQAGRVSHAPDYFARRADGSAVVVDCRPAERRKPRDLGKFKVTARACALAGWEYRLAGAADPVVTANLPWLAGYRHPRRSG